MTREDLNDHMDVWARLLDELAELELRTAVVEARLPGDVEVIQLRKDIADRRAVVVEALAQLRQVADLLSPPVQTLH